MAKEDSIIINDETKEQIELFAEMYGLSYEHALERLVRDGVDLTRKDLSLFLKNKKVVTP